MPTQTHPKHTPGPLEVDQATGHIVPLGGVGGGVCDPWGDTEEQRAANATRLVACWNACEGINPEAVPELLAACNGIMVDAQPCEPYIALQVPKSAYNAFRTAIAKTDPNPGEAGERRT